MKQTVVVQNKYISMNFVVANRTEEMMCMVFALLLLRVV